MPTAKFHILSTKLLGEALINEAARNNIAIDEIPFIDTVDSADEATVKQIHKLSAEKITAVFTSANAARAVGKQISQKTDWKIYCLGGTTRKMVSEIFGENKILATADNAQQLAEKIIGDATDAKIIFFCGDQRRDELPGQLNKNKIHFREIVVYNTRQTPQHVTKKYDGILFFSPSAVAGFFLKNKAGKQTRLFAIGATTAASIQFFSPLHVITAETPSKENLVKLAIQHFKGKN